MSKIPERPLLSVIMSCYNEVAVVGRAIESILNQTFSDFEFIIVDDASTDGTFEICQQYAAKDERIRLFRMEKNSGSCTRPLNLAIEKSIAPILARMDADDESYPDRFQKQYDFLMAHPEVDILGTRIRFIDKETGRLLGSYHYAETHKDIVRNKYGKAIVAHPTVMLRKQVYAYLGGYDERRNRGQDLDLWLKAIPKFTFHNLQEVLLDYYRTVLPKGHDQCFQFRNILALKFNIMRKNHELLYHWPVLLKDACYFIFVQIKILIKKITFV